MSALYHGLSEFGGVVIGAGAIIYTICWIFDQLWLAKLEREKRRHERGE